MKKKKRDDLITTSVVCFRETIVLIIIYDAPSLFFHITIILSTAVSCRLFKNNTQRSSTDVRRIRLYTAIEINSECRTKKRIAIVSRLKTQLYNVRYRRRRSV